jgi:hypothetical protein
MRALIIGLSLVLGAGAAAAQSITTRGALSCGKWVEQRRPNQVAWGETWLDGVLTGQSMAQRVDLLGGVPAESTYLWMDTYCRANPLRSTMDGAAQLVAELKKQKGL